MAEFGCLASTPIFSKTIPLAWEAPPKGFAYCGLHILKNVKISNKTKIKNFRVHIKNSMYT